MKRKIQLFNDVLYSIVDDKLALYKAHSASCYFLRIKHCESLNMLNRGIIQLAEENTNEFFDVINHGYGYFLYENNPNVNIYKPFFIEERITENINFNTFKDQISSSIHCIHVLITRCKNEYNNSIINFLIDEKEKGNFDNETLLKIYIVDDYLLSNQKFKMLCANYKNIEVISIDYCTTKEKRGFTYSLFITNSSRFKSNDVFSSKVSKIYTVWSEYEKCTRLIGKEIRLIPLFIPVKKQNIEVNSISTLQFKSVDYEISKKHINVFSFGNLFIFFNGTISTSIFKEHVFANIADYQNVKLGTIMPDRNFWMFTRDKLDKCKRCEYRFLCPPVTYYEYYYSTPFCKKK